MHAVKQHVYFRAQIRVIGKSRLKSCTAFVNLFDIVFNTWSTWTVELLTTDHKASGILIHLKWALQVTQWRQHEMD